MNYKDLQQELRNKERTVDDLSRHCGTIPDRNPNYCLLLGAGCSVTSGIRSGGQQVEIWRKEIFHGLYQEEKYEVDKAIQKLSTEHSAWYDPRNEYSSLFEKRYDLPRQRRMFVESEVANKNPSIGYAYLVKLIESSFFNTVFTTNFDDLLNEAFYRFSETRPITCAHDSAISSITVTSKRPKIIKLHGDFLFDDIKSTLRETESLENNMKNKFIEFSKDYGLVIVGYGGYDRSVLDVLTFLLKNEEYYKNGIYWCLREEDSIGTELHKLLWKDRVYYVKINGFDELFAELNKNLQPEMLPLDTKVMSNKSQIILKEIERNLQTYGSGSEIINNDISVIKRRFKDENLKLLFRGDDEDQPKDEKFQQEEISIEKRVAYLNLKRLLESGSFDTFEEELEKFENNYEGTDSVNRDILSLKAKYQSYTGNVILARTTYNTIYEQFGKYPEYLCSAAMLRKDDVAVELVEKAIERNKNYPPSYYVMGCIYATFYLEKMHKSEEYRTNAIENFKISLEKDPSKENPSWLECFGFLLECNTSGGFPEECDRLIERLEIQDEKYIDVVKMKLEKISKEKPSDYKEKAKKYIQESLENTYGQTRYDLLLNELRWSISNGVVGGFSDKLENFKKKYSDIDGEISSIEAQYLAKIKNDLNGAIQVLEDWGKNNVSKNISNQLFQLYLYDCQFDKAQELMEKRLKGSRLAKIDLLEAKGSYESAIIELDEDGYDEEGNVVKKAVLLMEMGRYDSAQIFLKNHLDSIGWSSNLMIINYELCNLVNKDKVKQERLQKVYSSDPSTKIKFGACVLLKRMNDAKKMLTELIENNYLSRREYAQMPIMQLPHCSELRSMLELS